MRRFIQDLREDFIRLAREEGEIYILEEFMINAIRIYRQRDIVVPQILKDTLPLVQKIKTAIDTGTWEMGEAPDLQDELEALSLEFQSVDHIALADAILKVGVDIDEEYKKLRDADS